MSLNANVSAGYALQPGERLTNSKLSRLAVPVVTLDIPPGSITPAMTALDAGTLPAGAAAALRGASRTPAADVVEGNGSVIDCAAYGAIGDGAHHAVQEWVDSGRYADLTAVQVDYPWVQALTDEVDWAAIQGALDRAWQMVKASYGQSGQGGLVDSLSAHAPVVRLRAGFYYVNRTLVKPPRVSLVGAGMQATTVQFTGTGETVWTNLKPPGADPVFYDRAAAGMHIVLLARDAVGVTAAHITHRTAVDALLDHGAVAYDTVGQLVYDTASRVAGLMWTSEVEDVIAICITGLQNDACTIEGNHFNGWGVLGQNAHYVGIWNADAQADYGMVRNLWVVNNVFEANRLGMMSFLALDWVVRGNHFWECRAVWQGSANWCVYEGNLAASGNGGTLTTTYVQVPLSLVMPAVGATVTVGVTGGGAHPEATLPLDSLVWLVTGGYFQVVGRDALLHTVTLKNLGYTGNITPGLSTSNNQYCYLVLHKGLWLAGAGNVIVGNTFRGQRECIRLYGGGHNVSGNVFLSAQWLSPAGWGVHILNRNAIVNVPWAVHPINGKSGESTMWGVDNAGLVVSGNACLVSNTVAVYNVPVLFETKLTAEYGGAPAITDGATEVMRGVASGNTVQGTGSELADPVNVYAFVYPTIDKLAGTSGIAVVEGPLATWLLGGGSTYVEITPASPLWRWVGAVQVGFNTADNDKVLWLPDPATKTGAGAGELVWFNRTVRLVVGKLATAGARKVTLKVGTNATPLAGKLTDSTGLVVDTIDVSAASTAATYAMVTVVGDGTYWHVR
jgi:hypothetical protein